MFAYHLSSRGQAGVDTTAAHRPLSVVAFILGCSSHLFSFMPPTLRESRPVSLWVAPCPICVGLCSLVMGVRLSVSGERLLCGCSPHRSTQGRGSRVLSGF